MLIEREFEQIDSDARSLKSSPPVAVQEAKTSLDHFIDDVKAAEKRDELPEPAFRLTWSGTSARYYVNKPNIDSTDCYTAEQMRQQFNAGREFEAQRAAMKGDQP